MQRGFDYTVETGKSVEAALAAVEAMSQNAGFRVLHVHDVQATLAARGIVRESMKIVEICNAQFANDILVIDPRISLMLPCPISIYADKGHTFISAMRPTMISDFFSSSDVAAIARQVEELVLKIVDSSR